MKENREQWHSEASVRRAHKGRLFSRRGRGFSLGELAKAGVEPVAARKLGLRVDERRRSVHEFNVETLKKRPLTSKREIEESDVPEEHVNSERAESVETLEAAG